MQQQCDLYLNKTCFTVEWMFLTHCKILSKLAPDRAIMQHQGHSLKMCFSVITRQCLDRFTSIWCVDYLCTGEGSFQKLASNGAILQHQGAPNKNWFLCKNSTMSWQIHFKFGMWITYVQGTNWQSLIWFPFRNTSNITDYLGIHLITFFLILICQGLICQFSYCLNLLSLTGGHFYAENGHFWGFFWRITNKAAVSKTSASLNWL